MLADLVGAVWQEAQGAHERTCSCHSYLCVQGGREPRTFDDHICCDPRCLALRARLREALLDIVKAHHVERCECRTGEQTGLRVPCVACEQERTAARERLRL